MPSNKKPKFYAVARGRKPGIYRTWDECKTQTSKFGGAVFKSFPTKQEAQSFIQKATGGNVTTGIRREVTEQSQQIQSSSSNTSQVSNKKLYVVAKGHQTGIYSTWKECQSQIKGYNGPIFKSVNSQKAARDFLAPHGTINHGIGGSSTTQLKDRKRPSSFISSAENPQVNTLTSTPASKTLKIQIWFDGGARGNPGVAGAGAHLIITTTTNNTGAEPCSSSSSAERSSKIRRCDSGNTNSSSPKNNLIQIEEEVRKINIRQYCGSNRTNNYAEYTGLKVGLLEAKKIVDEFCAHAKTAKTKQDKEITVKKEESNNNDDGRHYRIDIDIKGDSNLIMTQLSGLAVCRAPTLKGLYKECMELISYLRGRSNEYISVSLEHGHVYREFNKVADALANEAMDSRQSWKTTEGETDDDNDCTSHRTSRGIGLHGIKREPPLPVQRNKRKAGLHVEDV